MRIEKKAALPGMGMMITIVLLIALCALVVINWGPLNKWAIDLVLGIFG